MELCVQGLGHKYAAGADYAFNQVTPYLHDGADFTSSRSGPPTMQNALEDIINYAKNEGYTFKSLDELAIIKKKKHKNS